MRPVPEFPGYYATEQGDIISVRGEFPRYLSQRLHNGYAHVNVRVDDKPGRWRKIAVHLLVLAAFNGKKPFPHYQCRHLNGKALDNRPSNLDWGTPRENTLDAIRHGTAVCLRRGERHNRAKLTDEQVKEIRLRLAQGQSPKSVAAQYNVTAYHVRDIGLCRTRIAA